MKQNHQQIRTKLLTVIMAGVTGVGFAAAATAAGAGIGANANVGAGAQVTAPTNTQAGGSANTHMSTAGNANSNAQWQRGATQGVDRAADRMSNTDGLEQSTAAELGAAGMETAEAKRSGTR